MDELGRLDDTRADRTDRGICPNATNTKNLPVVNQVLDPKSTTAESPVFSHQASYSSHLK